MSDFTVHMPGWQVSVVNIVSMRQRVHACMVHIVNNAHDHVSGKHEPFELFMNSVHQFSLETAALYLL